jgi:pyruvate/2-oxoglutarate dehydrogenase complex dihydrolipoamide acyltransferase (E2) component
MRMIASLLVVVFVVVAVVPPVNAQSPHTAPISALESAVQEHVSSGEADREAVLRLLARPEVQAIAGDTGIDLRRVESAVGTLERSQLAEVAAQARQADQALAGGQSRVVISTTMIIIALLVLILIIVAVD